MWARRAAPLFPALFSLPSRCVLRCGDGDGDEKPVGRKLSNVSSDDDKPIKRKWSDLNKTPDPTRQRQGTLSMFSSDAFKILKDAKPDTDMYAARNSKSQVWKYCYTSKKWPNFLFCKACVPDATSLGKKPVSRSGNGIYEYTKEPPISNMQKHLQKKHDVGVNDVKTPNAQQVAETFVEREKMFS